MDTVFEKTFEHQQELFSAAIEEFAEKGYENASINTILAAAGMSKGQFYYHFGGKESLYFALITAVIQQKQTFLAQQMQPEDRKGDLFEILSGQLAYGLEFSRRFPEINRFADSFIREQGNPIYEKALKKYSLGRSDFLAQMVAEAYENGQLRRDLPLSFIQQAIGYIFTHAVEVAGLQDVDMAGENLKHLIEFLRAGFGNQSA